MTNYCAVGLNSAIHMACIIVSIYNKYIYSLITKLSRHACTDIVLLFQEETYICNISVDLILKHCDIVGK